MNTSDVYHFVGVGINRNELKNLNAEELMVIYQQRSPEEAYAAFNELYLRYDQRVFSFLMKKVKNQVDAEDLLQKVFIKVHESKHLYKSKFKFEQWLFVIARSAVIDHFRSKSRYHNRLSQIESDLSDDQLPSSSLLLETLNEDQKEMLEMKFIDDLSYQEMALILNKSETSLRKMVSRMMINLRKGNA